MKGWYLWLSVGIVVFSLIVRVWGFASRAPFDWDQNRDYASIRGIANGKITLIGPVAKGEGGFFLGPLYYYLATPLYILMDGSPRSLPLTSIMIDVLTVVAILALLRTPLGGKRTLVLAGLWSASWFAIESSRISWNVALVPLWSVLMLRLLSGKFPLSLTKVGLLGVVAGLSWHIHAALIPMVPLLLLFSWRRWASTLKHLGLLIVGYSIPLIPLLLFDMRHAGLNWYLLTQMVSEGGKSGLSYTTILNSLLQRLGKNTQSLLFGSGGYNLPLGIGVGVVAALALWRRSSIYAVAGQMILVNTLAVLGLQETGFPEYYLALCYLPTLLLITAVFAWLTRRVPSLLIVATTILIAQNIRQYTSTQTTFALSRKESLARDIASLGGSIDLRFDLAPGREGGIIPLLKGQGTVIEKESSLKVIVSDKGDAPLLIEGELTELIGHYGGMRTGKLVVE